jgi:hypothetical protein
VLVLSSILGFFIAITADADRHQLVIILLVMIIYPAELLASLVVVRSCGYRFVWQSSPQPGRPSDDGN